MTNGFGYIEEHEFIIYDDVEYVTLLTFEWYTEEDCNYPTIRIFNVFNKTTLTWNHDLKNHEKFKNFYNCPVVVNLPSNEPLSFNIDFITKEAHGLMLDIHKSVGQAGNFTPEISLHKKSYVSKKETRPNENVQIKYEVKTTLLFDTHTTMTFSQNKFIFVITPSEPYTIYEKMMMVFDEMTWTLLLLTFGIAFTVVFTINTKPLTIQNIVFGEKVRTPSMNILHIFFGIGQLKLPKNSFARFILINFIFFCLIFRTCYQSILFEFMTSDMRKPLPQTIDDLYFKNFTIITVGLDNIKRHIKDMIDEEKRPPIRYFKNPYYFTKFYLANKDNFTAKYAFLMPEDTLLDLSKECKCSPIVLDQTLFTIQTGFSTLQNHFLFDILEDVVEKFIPMGIVQHFYDFNVWLIFRIDAIMENKDPKILAFSDLSFGFIIWLIACGISTIAYICEIIRFKMRRKVRTLSGLFLFIILIWERMHYYRP